MIRHFLFAAATVLVCSTPSFSGSIGDIEELSSMIKKSETEIAIKNCNKDIAGFYEYQRGRIDRLVICKNRINMSDPDEVWEVLSHEATHIMQACNGGLVVVDNHHPRILRRLQEQAPHYWEILSEYAGEDKMREAEAFDMELQPPQYVKDWFHHFCLKR